MTVFRAANDPLIDYTRTLEFVAGHMIGEGCSVVLDQRQYPILVTYLERIAAVGDINFVLEQCIDHRPGWSLAWDNGGAKAQDDEVDRLMHELIEALGFQASPGRDDS